MPKRKEITMVEHLGDNDVWIWYQLHETLTPREAIKEYCNEMNMPCGKITYDRKEFTYYSTHTNVRAFKVTLYK